MTKTPFGAKDQLEIASLGTEFALVEILGAAGGFWLDSKWGTLPWCLLGGVILGFIWVLWRVISVAKEAEKQKYGRS